MKILAINPGSTSTKVSLFEDEKSVFEKNLFHDSSVLLQFADVVDQIPFRRDVILSSLKEEGVDPASIDAFSGRGDGAHTQVGGALEIDGRLFDDLAANVGHSVHPARLGAMLAWQFGQEFGKPAFMVNAENTDEYGELARLTGIKGVYRHAHTHVLNQKAVAEFHAGKLGRRYEDCNFIVAHIDGGITVGAHEHGRIVDATMGADGEGSFTPTRIGSMPVLSVLDYVDRHSTAELRLKCARAGGFVDLFGTSNSDTIHAMVDRGDRKATLVWHTMIYQICKMIGEMGVVLCGKVDGILLTGGLMRFQDIIDGITQRCGFIAPISVYPGEMEQEALALPVLKVLRGQAKAHTYTGRDVWNGFKDIDL